MSKLIKELCNIFQITKIQTSSYNPQTNSSCARMNNLANTTRILQARPQSNWVQLLPSIMFAYRSTPATESTQLSPFMILFRRECHLPIDTELLPQTEETKSNQPLEQIMQNFAITRKIAAENIKASRANYKASLIRKRKPQPIGKDKRFGFTVQRRQLDCLKKCAINGLDQYCSEWPVSVGPCFPPCCPHEQKKRETGF